MQIRLTTSRKAYRRAGIPIGTRQVPTILDAREIEPEKAKRLMRDPNVEIAFSYNDGKDWAKIGAADHEALLLDLRMKQQELDGQKSASLSNSKRGSSEKAGSQEPNAGQSSPEDVKADTAAAAGSGEASQAGTGATAQGEEQRQSEPEPAAVAAPGDAVPSPDANSSTRDGEEESRLAHNQRVAGSNPAPATSSPPPAAAKAKPKKPAAKKAPAKTSAPAAANDQSKD